MNATRILLAGLIAGMLGAQVRAADPTPLDIRSAERKSEAIAAIATAGDLAAFGKETVGGKLRSPESLVLAGGMLLMADKEFGGKSEALDAKPADAKGNAIKGDAEKSVSLADQAQALFDAATLAVAGDKARSAAVAALIKEAKEFKFDRVENERGSVGGPSVVTRTLQPGETHTYNLNFYSGQPAAVAMTSTGPARIQFDLTHLSGQSLLSILAQNANYNWTPAKDKDNVRKFTVTLTNNGKKPTTYTLTKN